MVYTASVPEQSWLQRAKRNFQRDQRWAFACFLTFFAVMGQIYLGFFQDWSKVLAALGAAVITELVLGRLIKGQWILPLSAYITGVGTGLLLSSQTVWAYAAVGSISIASKYAIRFRGKHIFNPNNFGMVVFLLLFPHIAVSTPQQWGNAPVVAMVIFLIGCLVAYKADRLQTVLTFFGSFIVFALLRYQIFYTPLFAALGPLLGSSLQLFMFFMITDPQTSPAKPWARVLYAIAIALVDAYIRVLRIPNAPFHALFIVCLLVNILLRPKPAASPSPVRQVALAG